MTSPALTYYRACVGRWRSTMAITITDAAALKGSGMSWLDRVSVRLLAWWPGWLGPVYLDTTVAFEGDEVVHITVVRWLSIPMRTSRSADR